MAKRVRKILREGDRTTFYLKKDFPREMLDWMNGQSDMQLLFEYALDHLYQNVGPVDVAGTLPRNYEIGQGLKVEGIAAPPITVRTAPAEKTEKERPVKEEITQPAVDPIPEPSFSDKKEIPVDSDIIKVEEENPEEEVEPAQTKPAEEKEEKKSNSWSGLNNVDDSGYF